MSMFPKMVPNKIYLDEIFDDFMFPRIKASDFGSMKCDIYEKDNAYYLEMDIPGFSKDDVNLEINNNDYLTITAEKNNEKTENSGDKNYIRKERSYGKYQRMFYVGGIDKEKIEANFENGMLKVIMPKKQEVKSLVQKIEIK